ncbi:hypothetical protein HT746_00935 [Burkholderia pyrrocinia]|uniref:hypothetical protein n=1 Tax=Burkholderia pyrrocinia TaxID=60550 RepID=UPI001574FD12|nr:hypothetical protein [Burkholderia pyrrocinia]NTX25728.1 hypothetical protein [Burkholderia pyrrocinia]
MESRIPDAQHIAPEQMSPIEQAFLTEVGRSGVSDMAFKFALMVVPMLSFVSWQTLFLGDVAKRAGLSDVGGQQCRRRLLTAKASMTVVERLWRDMPGPNEVRSEHPAQVFATLV